MRPALFARPEQTVSHVPIDIIRRALREAALAATDAAALDITGEALRQLASLSAPRSAIRPTEVPA